MLSLVVLLSALAAAQATYASVYPYSASGYGGISPHYAGGYASAYGSYVTHPATSYAHVYKATTPVVKSYGYAAAPLAYSAPYYNSYDTPYYKSYYPLGYKSYSAPLTAYGLDYTYGGLGYGHDSYSHGSYGYGHGLGYGYGGYLH